MVSMIIQHRILSGLTLPVCCGTAAFSALRLTRQEMSDGGMDNICLSEGLGFGVFGDQQERKVRTTNVPADAWPRRADS